MKHVPPKLPHRFFRWYCHPKLLKYIEGDLLELHEERVKTSGKTKADLRFVMDVIFLFRPGIIRPAEGHQHINMYGMYKNYVKIGWRTLLRNKGYSFINIGGLALGMAVAILIALWVLDELTFNKNHDHYNTIAEVYRRETREGETFASNNHTTGLGTLLKTTYANHFQNVVMARAKTEERVIAHGDKKFTQRGYFMQPEGPSMFSLKMLQGRIDGLKDIKSIFLSQSLAKKLFDDSDPINRVVSMDAKWDLTVAGVYEDLPHNSRFFDASYFAPLDLYLDGWATLDSWDNYHMYVFVQVPEGSSMEHISSVINHCSYPFVDEETRNRMQEFFLHPMKDWHLNAQFENGILTTSRMMLSVWYYSAIGIFVLLLAAINFMNLTTARSEKRAKEVGIRKSIGSLRGQLVQQFYGESFLVALLAFGTALALAYLTLPAFNELAGKSMELPLRDWQFWVTALSFVLFTGLLAGSYPALYLSSFNPVRVLKGSIKVGKAAVTPRKILVVLQFTISISLAIGTWIVYEQLQFAKNRPVGYNRKALIGMRAASPEFKGKYQVLQAELKNTGFVEEMAEANYAITDYRGWNGGFSWKGNEYEPTFNTIFVTHEYGNTIGWEFLQGRDFSRAMASDTAAIVINELALAILGIEQPIGEVLTWAPGGSVRGSYEIVGVVKDMIKGSPYEDTFPSIIFLSRQDMQWLYIRMKASANPHEALPAIANVFAQLVPSAPFDFTFADDAYAAKFLEEERIGKLATLFSVLAIVISCLGLFGLAAFSAEQRTKEIGIRKVLGASVAQVWQLLSKDFVLLTAFSSLLAIPLTWYLMHQWLMQFTYRTEIPLIGFVSICAGGMVLTLLIVSVQAIRAATFNPVRSLRSE